MFERETQELREQRKVLAFGLNGEAPEGCKAAYGARLIFPDDVVWDRQDVYGRGTEEGDRLGAWCDSGALTKALKAARKMAESGKLRKDGTETVVLYEDSEGIVKGNPNGSHGYLYIVAYLKEK